MTEGTGRHFICHMKTECVVFLFSRLEGEGVSLLSHFLHEEFQHWCFGCGSFYRRIPLNALDLDVSPEGQTHDVQVLASIAEGTSEVDEYCETKRGHSALLHVHLGSVALDVQQQSR